MGVCVGIEMSESAIKNIIDQVKNNLLGRYADAGGASETLLKVVERAGDGNYLEFGVLHGGSLCAVALYKKAMQQYGVCVGVDLFDGWYLKKSGKKIDKSGVPVNLEVVKTNINKFGLENVKLVQSETLDYETDMRFVVAYIDAGHDENECYQDWLKVKDITSKFVVFHDYLLIDGVTKACNRAEKDPDWTVFEKRKGVFVLQRIDLQRVEKR